MFHMGNGSARLFHAKTGDIVDANVDIPLIHSYLI